ncbi:MAG: DNA-binding response regulator [Acidobacteria bacterium]|nr:MAG: DNA-binding response regulator [Acidobacteriota bacterium]
MNALRLLIVDDEPLIRRGIRKGLANLEGVEIVGDCANGAEAIQTILSAELDLVLLDVQMPDCDGLEVIRQVGAERMPLVIFATAHDEYAVSAFEMNAVDYLLKPFDEARLRAAIARARERHAAKNREAVTQQLESLLRSATKAAPERFVIRNGQRYEFVPADTVDWVESANNYVQLHCGPKTHLMSETLTRLEKRLDPAKFLRVHRGRIVNVSRILAVHSLMNGVFELELRNGLRITTGRQFRDAVQSLLRK